MMMGYAHPQTKRHVNVNAESVLIERRNMPLLIILVFLAVIPLGWGISKYILSRRAHPHETTEEYAALLKKNSSFSEISVAPAARNAPMWIEGIYKEQPFLMTVITLYREADHSMPYHIHGYMSAIRITIPAKILGQEDVVVYRKVEQKLANGNTLLEMAGGQNTAKLSKEATQSMIKFIGSFGSLRYRSRIGISPLIVPADIWTEETMIISHERFYSSTDIHEICSLLDGLHDISAQLKHP